MAATAEQIRNKAMIKLGVLAIGQTPDSAIASDIDAAYSEVYSRLEENSLAVWASTAEVPDEYVKSVVALVAFERADDYSVSSDRYQRLMIAANKAEPEIRRIINGPYIPTTTPSNYY